jgi:hypothetical protein
MPKKTLILISGLVLVTVVLFVFALRSNNQQNVTPVATQPTSAVSVSPETPAHSILAISPNPVTVQPGQEGTAEVTIDTADNNVTAVQLEIAYDPTIIGNIQLKPGSLFENSVVLINKNNAQTGRFTYAFGITPNHSTVKGIGTVATITFIGKKAGQSQLSLLPASLITARGVKNSVLKSATGTIVNVGGSASANNGNANSGIQTPAPSGYWTPERMKKAKPL